ncbi:hypothetical protein BHE74_00009025 [Ensete ventricosum]|nr:hypothetical protein GW17_00005737 [Ensete ventricosum]RWW82512.1 hypothetical protein BHE74_00009025 [Ensete ventricosum]
MTCCRGHRDPQLSPPSHPKFLWTTRPPRVREGNSESALSRPRTPNIQRAEQTAMASRSGGVGRGRSGRGHAPSLGAGIAPRECECCRAEPGIPFCRVEWSFLCAGCAAGVHGQSWIVAVPPGPNPGSNLNPVAPGAYSLPYACQYPCPNSNPNPSPHPPPLPTSVPPPNLYPNPGTNLNHVVQLSSDEDVASAGEDGDGGSGRKRRRASAEGGSSAEASMMRDKEMRKNQKSQKVHADIKPRVDGKSVDTADSSGAEGEDGARGEGEPDSGGDEARVDSSEDARTDAAEELTDLGEQLRPVEAGEMVATSPSFEVEQFDEGVDLGQINAGEEVGLL